MFKFKYLEEGKPFKSFREILRVANTEELIQFDNGYNCKIEVLALENITKDDLMRRLKEMNRNSIFENSQSNYTGFVADPTKKGCLSFLNRNLTKLLDHEATISIDVDQVKVKLKLRIVGVKSHHNLLIDEYLSKVKTHSGPSLQPA